MSYSVDMSQESTVHFAPDLLEEIMQNIRTICSTALGSSAGAREIGIDMSMLDEPIPIIKTRLASTVMTAVMEQEPRATVTEVIINENHETGRMVPLVRFELAEEVQG